MKPCAHCGRPTIPRCQWRALTPDERAAQTAHKVSIHQGRGLCTKCYRQPAIRDEYDRTNQPLETVLEEWRYLADPMVPVRREVRRLAPRLGMKEKTLEKIVTMNIGSRFESGHGERFKRAS